MLKAQDHHYVPQSHLRRFTRDGKKLWVFDKLNQQCFPNNVKDVAQHLNYYRLYPELTEGGPTASDAAEEAFCTAENAVSPLIDDAVETALNGGQISEELRGPLSEYLALQYLRVPKQRNAHVAFQRKVSERIMDLLVATEMPGVDPAAFRVELGAGGEAAIHVRGIFNENAVELAGLLRGYIWVFWTTEAESLLYSSDAPVSLIPPPEPPHARVGFASRGVHVAVALSSHVLLAMFDPRYFAVIQHAEFCTVPLDQELVDFYNRMQVLSSTRQVYCGSDDFAVARKECARPPVTRH